MLDEGLVGVTDGILLLLGQALAQIVGLGDLALKPVIKLLRLGRLLSKLLDFLRGGRGEFLLLFRFGFSGLRFLVRRVGRLA